MIFSQKIRSSSDLFKFTFRGDTLQVDVASNSRLRMDRIDLSDEYPESALKIWKLDKENASAWFDEDRYVLKVLYSHCRREMGVALGEESRITC